MSKDRIVIIVLVLLFFVVGAFINPQMPERMASHWNAQGQVDGYTSRFLGVFLVPLIALGLAVLLMLMPRLDPLKANVDQFRNHYHGFIIALLLFLFYLYLLTIFWNLDFRFNMTRLLVPAFAGLFYATGVLIENSKRNWFIGIRTAWSLSSDEVWERTHRFGGKLFKAVSLITLLGIVFQRYAIFFILVPVIAAAIAAVVYSYFDYKREMRKRQAANG